GDLESGDAITLYGLGSVVILECLETGEWTITAESGDSNIRRKSIFETLDWYSPTMFGAVGDEDDATVAFQRCAEVVSATGGVFCLPVGRYYLEEGFTSSSASPVHVLGQMGGFLNTVSGSRPALLLGQGMDHVIKYVRPNSGSLNHGGGSIKGLIV